MKLTFTIFVIVFFGCQALAQLSPGEFLKSALEDPEIKTFSEQTRYLATSPYRLSWLQRLEFRTQNRELSPGQQEFALRVTPSNPWEVRNNNRYFREYQSTLAFENEFVLKAILSQRYRDIISMLYLHELRALKERMIQSKSDQLAILEQQMGSSFFDADNYVDTQIAKLDQSADLEEIRSLIDEQVFSILRKYPQARLKAITWTYQDVLSIDRMKNVVDSLQNLALVSRMISYQQQKIRLAQQEYKLEKANINVGFLQTEFDHRRVEQNRTPINISLGITIPIVNPNKGDMTKRYLEEIDAKFDLEEASSEDKIEKQLVNYRVHQLFKRYDDLKRKIQDFDAGELGSDLQKLKKGDPLVRVKVNESLIKLTVALNRIRRDIFDAYIEFLATTDFLQQMPLTNFLSTEMEKL